MFRHLRRHFARVGSSDSAQHYGSSCKPLRCIPGLLSLQTEALRCLRSDQRLQPGLRHENKDPATPPHTKRADRTEQG